MQDWTEGYVGDIAYTHGYYGELNPLHAKLTFAASGYVFPTIEQACELGYGQGLSINIHASSSIITWSGTDFNPSQAGFAQELAKASGNNANLLDESFTKYCVRNDLPDFDYIGLHGIWSWISNNNRKIIVDFISRKLKVGGVLFISYNTLPGWSSIIPIRNIMTEHAKMHNENGYSTVNRINEAIYFTEKLISTNPQFIKANPALIGEIEKIKKLDRSYLAHEYFNKDWLPMPFSEIAEWLKPAKLQYVCSASYVDQLDIFNLTEEQQKFLSHINNPILYQTVRDFMTNSRFRKDYWIKGARKLTPLENLEKLRKQKFVLIKNKHQISLKISVPIGQITLNEKIYTSLINYLSDYKTKSLVEIEEQLSKINIPFPQILEAIMILIGIGVIGAAQDEESVAKVKSSTDKLNQIILDKSRSMQELSYLASPLLAGGIAVHRFNQLFILANKQGKKLPHEWAKFAWEILSLQGQKIIRDGKTLESQEENLKELTSQATTFSQNELPILKGLQVI